MIDFCAEPRHTMSQQLADLDRHVLLLGPPDRITAQDGSRMLCWWRLYTPQLASGVLIRDIGVTLGRPDQVSRHGDRGELVWFGPCTAFVLVPWAECPIVWTGLAGAA